ncbi:MAG: hypothetical protein FH748_12200 [Balneolaceae bacterium]|nr:hypothetical protein [Balneolaceae bacterium]
MVLLLGVISTTVVAQSSGNPNKVTEDIEMKISAQEFNKQTLFHMKNVHGSVRVKGYGGDDIMISGEKTVWKKKGTLTREDLDKIYLEKVMAQNNLYVYIQAPGVEVNIDDGKLHYHVHMGDWEDSRWGKWEDKKKSDLRFEFELELKVPHALMASFSTINGGEVVVENMTNGVHAKNVNGKIVLKEIAGQTEATTVNGNIEVWFAKSPTLDTWFRTVNGTIKVYSPKDLSTVVTFKSLHGDLYTDFENIEHLPNRLNKKLNDEGTRYKIHKTAPIKIGDGGPEMSFKLVNGSAYIRQRKS